MNGGLNRQGQMKRMNIRGFGSLSAEERLEFPSLTVLTFDTLTREVQ